MVPSSLHVDTAIDGSTTEALLTCGFVLYCETRFPIHSATLDVNVGDISSFRTIRDRYRPHRKNYIRTNPFTVTAVTILPLMEIFPPNHFRG
jgi:hypothetical protein